MASSSLNLAPSDQIPLPPCGCEPQCVPGVCRTTCENIDPVCCGLSPDGVPGVCDPTTAQCCYPSCTGKSCGTDDGCGGKCGCQAPLDCVYDSPDVCAVISDAYVAGDSFYAVAMTTETGVPVSAQFPVQRQGAVYTILSTECGLVQTGGVNFMMDTLAADTAPAQRISYWSAQYYGDNAFALSCVVNSLGRAGFPSSGPFYLVDPSQTQLGSLMSSVATDAMKLACTLTPIAMPGHTGAFVQITAVLRSGGLHTLGAIGGQLAWVPGSVLPGTGIYVAWHFGGCMTNDDCTGKMAPYCQIGNTCGASPTAYVSAPSEDMDCGTVCGDSAVLASTGWDQLGFTATGIYLGGPFNPERRSDESLMCQCQAYASVAEAATANAMAKSAALTPQPSLLGMFFKAAMPKPAMLNKAKPKAAMLKTAKPEAAMLKTAKPKAALLPAEPVMKVDTQMVTVPTYGFALLVTVAIVFFVLFVAFAAVCSRRIS